MFLGSTQSFFIFTLSVPVVALPHSAVSQMDGAFRFLRPSPLVKVMIPPPSPPSFSLYVLTALLLLRRRHIKPHLTSISVKETGASGCCGATTQPLPPPQLLFTNTQPFPAIPPALASPQRPFSAVSRFHFFHFPPPDKRLISVGD